jgi:hypothetical protein
MRRLLALALLAASLLPLVGTEAASSAAAATRLYYVADEDVPGVYGLYSRDLGSSTSRLLFAGHNGTAMNIAQVSPDGTQVAFTLTDANASQLWTVEASGANAQRRRVFANRDAFGIRWSPDGTRLVLNDGFSPDPRVRVFDLATGGTTVLEGTSGFLNPTFDPADPTHLYGDQVGGGIVRFASTLPVAATAVNGPTRRAVRPVVSSDGSTIAYTDETDPDDVDPKADLRSVTDHVVKVLATGQYSARPSLGPDSTVYFDKVAGPELGYISDLWSVPIDGSSAAVQLTDTANVDEYSVSAGPVSTAAPTGVVDHLRIGLDGATPRLEWTLPDGVSDVVICRVAGTTPPAAPCANPVYQGPGQRYVDRFWSSSRNLVYSWTVFVADAYGNVAATGASLTARLIEAPRVSLALPTSATTGTAPFRVRWGSPAAPAGTTYDLTWSVKRKPGYALAPFQAWASTTGTTAVFGGNGAIPTAVAPGESYYVRVQTGDEFGNRTLSATARGVVPLDQGVARYSSGWSSENGSGRWLGSIRGTQIAGASATVALTGADYSVIGERCTSCGQFQVYVDGVLKGTFDTRASTYSGRQNVWTGHFKSIRTRTLEVVAVGTSGRPRINLDGFAAWR